MKGTVETLAADTSFYGKFTLTCVHVVHVQLHVRHINRYSYSYTHVHA
jgi:hypothetical protein